MTKSSAARAQRRQLKRKAHAAITAGVKKLTPEEAREMLGRWAAAGGDLKYLMDSGRVRYKEHGDVTIAAHPEARPVIIDRNGVTTINILKERFK